MGVCTRRPPNLHERGQRLVYVVAHLQDDAKRDGVSYEYEELM